MALLALIARWADGFNETVGRTVAWLGLAMVSVQFLDVVLRYVFGVGWIPVQESILYFHSMVFLLGAGFALKYDQHVRVDLFYREATPRKKALIDVIGCVIFLFPFCIATLIGSWPSAYFAVMQMEGSGEPLGLHLLFALKAMIVLFATVLAIQGLSLLCRGLMVLGGHAETHFPHANKDR